MALGSKLNPTLRAFIERQPMFFVASAAAEGRVNLSPKGADTLRIVDDTHLSWLNLSGSGNETAGHVAQLNRITLMFCAFEGDALILRLYGTARVIHPHDADWTARLAAFPDLSGSRQIFDVAIEAVQTSCGTGVPRMTLTADRAMEELVPYWDGLDDDQIAAYWRRKNAETIDGFDTGLIRD
ncbi:pyridoxamine 5'-phosphate oxidase family protein [uncultured Jannaschia sp.]|uniref:pyridoxamine 5'-phosphate oxidase family protein n=1 Tax=uncultured Jannaschia sp. TaxID=293347 RepID=UPI00261E7218|nr:pyridoxamine 5'-phosphate oxidase family protein [uncultured Jannaschia sp.]